MNIILIGPAYPWRGGIAHHTSLLAKHLAISHKVEVITFKRQYPSLLFPGRTQYETGEHPSAFPALQWIDSINPLNWIATAFRLRRKFPDIIIFAYALPFFGPCYGTIAALVRWRSKSRTLFLCHNIVPHEVRPGDRLFTRFAFAFADFFVVQSETVQTELLTFHPRAKHRVAAHPVFEMFGQLIDKQDARRALSLSAKRVILFFGYVREYKGLGVLLRAMASLDDVTLLVVGEFYDAESSYRRLIDELHIGDRVRITNEYVPSQLLPRYFSAADAVVLPYLSATQSGIAQIAYHFEKPIIASNVGGLAEVVVDGQTGYLVPPNNVDALVTAIRRFYTEGREAEFAGNITIVKQQYSWSRMVQAIEELAGDG